MILPWTKYGVAVSFGGPSPSDHRTRTDSVSGVTFTFGSLVLNGHKRDGTPLLNLPRVLKDSESFTLDCALDVSSSGAWLAYKRPAANPPGNIAAYARMVDLEGNDVGDVLTVYPPDAQGPYGSFGVLTRSDGTGWLAVSSGDHIYGFDLALGKVGPPVVFVEGDGKATDLLTFAPNVREVQGRRWFYFGNGKGQARLLAIEPGCVYPALEP